MEALVSLFSRLCPAEMAPHLGIRVREGGRVEGRSRDPAFSEKLSGLPEKRRWLRVRSGGYFLPNLPNCARSREVASFLGRPWNTSSAPPEDMAGEKAGELRRVVQGCQVRGAAVRRRPACVLRVRARFLPGKKAHGHASSSESAEFCLCPQCCLTS